MTADRRTVLPLVALAPLLALGACSSSSSSASSTPATSGASSSATPAAGASSASGGRLVTAQGTTPTAGTQSGSVAIIGDSLTYQSGNGQKAMTAELVKAGWDAKKICWSGSDGRTVVGTLPGGAPDSVAEVARCRKQVGEPSLWIIALVTNNLDEKPAALSADMDKLLTAIGPDAKVLWVDAGRRDTAESGVKLAANDTVKKVVAARPHTWLADWYSFLTTQKDQAGWWVDDGTHMTVKGYAVRNAFIAAQAQSVAAAS